MTEVGDKEIVITATLAEWKALQILAGAGVSTIEGDLPSPDMFGGPERKRAVQILLAFGDMISAQIDQKIRQAESDA